MTMTMTTSTSLPAQRTGEDGRSQPEHRALELAFCDSEGRPNGKTYVKLPCACGWHSTPQSPTLGTGSHRDEYRAHAHG